MFGLQKWIGIAALSAVTLSCVEENRPEDSQEDNFDRQALLAFWADEIIVPAYQNYTAQLLALDSSVSTFQADPTLSKLSALRTKFEEAYLAWQWASIYEIGPAESRSLRNFTNIYPCDTLEIQNALNSANYNLSLPSTFDSQGFPALDYLLFGLGDDTQSLALLSQPKYYNYLKDLSGRLLSLGTATLQEWTNSYRDSFVAKDGSSADASVNKLTNDYIFHVEKELRAGKIGIPAGVFSGNNLPDRAEAFYHGALSRTLFLESLAAHQAFFEGRSFDQNQNGPSLKAYLDYLGINSNSGLLSDAILTQYDLAGNQAQSLDPSLAIAARDQTSAMLELFDLLQQNVVWLKVDMMQALNIRIDYVDADGD